MPRRSEHIQLQDSAHVVVIGGGPAGCFFAVDVLTEARRQGRELKVSIIEQKSELLPEGASGSCREGCNYCAGGISPRLIDVLEDAGIPLTDVIQRQIESVTIQGSWKHIELPVPPDRRMYTVYRGSRPCVRAQRNESFDSYLLECAVNAGGQIITGQACGVTYSPEDKPVVAYTNRQGEEQSVEADFAVVAGGVNQVVGMSLINSGLIQSLRSLIPGFQPPPVRKALICELKFRDASVGQKGEVFFVEYGSKDLNIAMSSLVPKEEGLITLVLLGKSVDQAGDDDKMDLIKRFLAMPHLQRLLPGKLKPQIVCACFPNMTVGTARKPYGHRIAMIGDVVVARLYKDGILSAHSTAKALSRCLLDVGMDERSLEKGFRPTIRSLDKDNRYGRLVFLLNHIAFSQPAVSRTVYQALLTERKSRLEGGRYLERLLWKIASGDDTYENIFFSMITGRALKAMFVGGVLVTIRNYLTEQLFGLHWGDIGRHPTGVYYEVMEAKRREYEEHVPVVDWKNRLDFERMYSIKIRAGKEAVLGQLAQFGEPEMGYFRPRVVKIRKDSGAGNGVGKVIRYQTPLPALTFGIILEAFLEERYIVYRVLSGFARGGVLIFDVEDTGHGSSLLSIYVAFNFRRGQTPLRKIYRGMFKLLFPHYVHDVLWNCALCQLKDIAEGS